MSAGNDALGLAAAAGKGLTSVSAIVAANILAQQVTRKSAIIASGLTGVGSAGGWSSGAAAVDSVNVRRAGQPVIRITSPDGNTAELATRIKIPVRVVNGKLEAWVYLPEITAGTRYFGFRLSSDTPSSDPPTGATANNTRIVYTSALFNAGAWQCQTVGQAPGGKIYGVGSGSGVTWTVNGSPDYTTVQYVEVFFSCDANVPSGQRYMLVDQIAVNSMAKPLVLFGFDGYNLTSHQTIVQPLFRQLGIQGYLAGDGNQAASVNGFLTSLYNDGWDIVSSGMNHTNYAQNPSLLSGDYDTARAILDGYGFARASRVFAYPNTARTDATDATLRSKGVIMSRQPYGPPNVISNLGITDLMQYSTFDWGLQAAATIQGWTDTAYANGEVYSILNHTVVTGSTQSTDTEKATFIAEVERIVARQDAGLLEIVTPTQLAARLDLSLSH